MKLKIPKVKKNRHKDFSVSRTNLKNFNFSKAYLITFAVLFAAIGGYILLKSFAATPTLPVYYLNTGPCDQDPHALKCTNLDTVNRTATTFCNQYSGGDSPFDYLCWLLAGANTATYDVPLGLTAQPGDYKIAINAIWYDSVTLSASAGGGPEVQLPSALGVTYSWTKTIPIHINQATDHVTFKQTRVPGSYTGDVKLGITGFYFTNNLNEVVIKDSTGSTVLNLHQPSAQEMNVGSNIPGNLVPNSSFENNVSHGWQLMEEASPSVNDGWVNNQAVNGSHSYFLNMNKYQWGGANCECFVQGKMVSGAIRLRPNRTYTLTAYVKTDPGMQEPVWLGMENIYKPPDYLGIPQSGFIKAFTATDQWQRISVTGDLYQLPTSDFRVSIMGQVNTYGGANPPKKDLWFDAVQLEEGPSATPYKPAQDVELGLKTDKTSNIFYDTDDLHAKLNTYNSSTSAQTKTIHYQIFDYLNHKLKDSALTVTTPAQSGLTTPLDISTRTSLGKINRGAFRVVAWIEGEDYSIDEMNTDVVAPPQRLGMDVASEVGVHTSTNNYDALTKLGVKWDRALSPGAYFRWSNIEPTKGQFTWYDGAIDTAVSKGVAVLGSISTNDFWPNWANQSCDVVTTWEQAQYNWIVNNCKPDPNRTMCQQAVNGKAQACLADPVEYGQFAAALAAHYKGRVPAWEFWNEPYGFPVNWTAQMMKAMADGIEAQDPNAKIIGMGGVYRTDFIENVITQMNTLYPGWDWRQHFDAVSTHLYQSTVDSDISGSATADGWKSAIIDKYNMPVWNTESGGKDDSWYFTNNNSDVFHRGFGLSGPADASRHYNTATTNLDGMMSNFLSSIGNGLTNYFYYDVRRSTSYYYDNWLFTGWMYDDTYKPRMIAYSSAANLIDHSQGQGKLNITGLKSMLYKRTNPDNTTTSVAALWTGQGQSRTLNLSGLSAGQYKVYDTMNNQLAINNDMVTVDRDALYIEAVGISQTTFKNALESAVNTAVSDTIAPNISIDEAPMGQAYNAAPRFKFTAIDNKDINAVQYQYRLIGPGQSGNWNNWTLEVAVNYPNLQAGTYEFNVQAKDNSGNLSSIATASFTVGTSGTTPPPLPTVTLAASPTSINSGSTSALIWSSTNANSCTASGGWSGTKATSGSQATPTLSTTTSFSLACIGPGGSANASTTVTVNAAVPGDVNGDGHVNIVDLSILLSHYGQTTTTGDCNGDSIVNIVDLSILLSNYGK